MNIFSRFLRFWYDFIVGDDPVVAVVVILAVAATTLLTHIGWNAWLLLPSAVFVTLATSSWRAVHHRRTSGSSAASGPEVPST